MVEPTQETPPMNTPNLDPERDDTAALLHEGLNRFELKWKQQQRRLGAGRFLLAAVVLLLVAAFVDLVMTPEGAARAGLSLLFYASLAAAAWFLWARPVLRPLSAEKIAWMIEDTHPELNEKLISAVELEKEREGTVSRAMILQTIADTEVDLGRVDPERDLAPPRWLKLLPAGVGALMLILMLVPGLYLPLRIKRIMLPATTDAAVSTFALRWVEAPQGRVPENTTLRVTVERTRDTGEQVVLEIQGEQSRRLSMRWNEADSVFEGEFTVPNHTVWVYARSGGASTRRVQVEPMLRPWIENLILEIHPPAYTGARVRVLDSWPRELEVVEGSRIHLQVTGNEPLSRAAVLSDQDPVELSLTSDTLATGDWVPTHSGEYTLWVKDREELEPLDSPRLQLRVLPDLPPTVSWVAPETDMLLREGDSLPLVWTASDDFGVMESRVVIRKNRDAPVVVTVTPVNGRYTYDVSDWSLGGGDELRVQVFAKDALGQEGESPLRTLSVAGGLDHAEAQQVLRDLTALRLHMNQSGPPLEALQQSRAGIFEAVVYETPSALENLEFQRVRWQISTSQLDSNLNEARSRAEALRQRNFFSPGAPALELLSRYMEQERVRLHAVDPSTLQTGPGVEGVYELGLPLLTELQRLADIALPALQAARLETMVALTAPREDAASRRLLEDLRHRAVVFANRHAPEQVAALEALDLRPDTGEPASGLRRWMWLERRTYTYDPGTAGARMDTESHINHPNLPSMNLGGNQLVSILWLGRVRAERGGTYRFDLESDDGSRLYVGDQLVVRNDGNHAMQRREGQIELSPGLHPVRIVYFNSGGGGGIIFRWQPPGRNEWEVVPSGVLYEPGNVGAMSFHAMVSGLRARLEREAGNLRELERWMARIRERLESPESLLAASTDPAEIAALAEALRLRAEAEENAALARLADELARAGLREDDQAVERILQAVASLARDREQETWETRLREETQRAMDLVRGLEDLSSLEEEAERRAQLREEAERLRALANEQPETGTDRHHEQALREAAREARRMAEEMAKLDADPAERIAAMERHQENLETRLDRAEAASKQELALAEDRLRAALPAASEEIASSSERLAGAEDAIAALAQERERLESVIQALRESLDLRREADQRISPENVRDQRIAEALERQIAAEDPAAVQAALEAAQPLVAAQEQARREALTQGEEAALSQAVREATEPMLSPAEAEAFDRMERLAEAREQVERLAREAEALGNQPVPERLAEEVARAQAALADPAAPQQEAPPRIRAEQAQLEAAMERMRALENPLARARLHEDDSEVRKSLEQAFRESERLQNELAKMATPENARLQEMAEAVERHMRAGDVRGAEETLAAMQRQVDEWAGENPVAPRLAEQAGAATPTPGDPAQQMAQAAEALEQAAAFEEAIPPALAAAQQQAEQARAHAEQGQWPQAAVEAQQAAQAAEAAGQPGEPTLADAGAPEPGAPGETGLAEAGAPVPGASTAPTDPSDQTDLAPPTRPTQAAEAQLAAAEAALRQGDTPQAAQALQAAAQSLAQAQAETAVSQPASRPGAEPGEGQSDTPSMAEGGAGGEGGSLAESQGGADPDLWQGPQGGNWEGARSDMDTGDPRRAGQQYSPYFRRAIQQYMRDLQEEQTP